jgi:Predicted acyl-CoA transferases/carnitine dehydratase
VLTNEQIQARGAVTTLDHLVAGEIQVLEHPLNFENSDSGFKDSPPLLGEDTEATLRDMGYNNEGISRLRRDGVSLDR